MHRRPNEERFTAETTPVPLLTLFALEALLNLEAPNSNNVRGGTYLDEAGGAKKSGRVSGRIVPCPLSTSPSHLRFCWR